jgi:fatty-acyl-CoA synthase
MIAGYHDNHQATRDSQRDGFFSVGDLARIDERGCYHIVGRKRDMIISGGVNVYPAEVEQVLATHPGVAEVAVVGVPDDEWGERVVAFIVRSSEEGAVQEEQLASFARERLSGPKRPRSYRFVNEMPRNPTGKLLKRKLREWLEQP